MLRNSFKSTHSLKEKKYPIWDMDMGMKILIALGKASECSANFLDILKIQ
jgi:hypothetical protein